MHACICIFVYLVNLTVKSVEFICKLPLHLGVNCLRQNFLGLAVKQLLHTPTSKFRQRRKQVHNALPLLIEHLLSKRGIQVQLVHELVAQSAQILDCYALLAFCSQ